MCCNSFPLFLLLFSSLLSLPSFLFSLFSFPCQVLLVDFGSLTGRKSDGGDMDAVSAFYSVSFDMRTLNEFYLIPFLVYYIHRYFILFSFVLFCFNHSLPISSPLITLLSLLFLPLFYRTHLITSSHNNVPHLHQGSARIVPWSSNEQRCSFLRRVRGGVQNEKPRRRQTTEQVNLNVSKWNGS